VLHIKERNAPYVNQQIERLFSRKVYFEVGVINSMCEKCIQSLINDLVDLNRELQLGIMIMPDIEIAKLVLNRKQPNLNEYSNETLEANK